MDPSDVATETASPTHTPESRASQKPPTATRSLPGIAYTDPVLYRRSSPRSSSARGSSSATSPS